MSRLRRAPAAFVALGAVVLLSGCSGSPDVAPSSSQLGVDDTSSWLAQPAPDLRLGQVRVCLPPASGEVLVEVVDDSVVVAGTSGFVPGRDVGVYNVSAGRVQVRVDGVVFESVDVSAGSVLDVGECPSPR